MKNLPRRLTYLLAALLLPILAAAQGPSALLHKQAPQFVRTGVHQETVDLSTYRGKVVLLNFWATWCAPCQIEIPRFVQWQSAYGSQGLQIIGVSMDDDPGPVLALSAKRHVNFPMLMGDAHLGEQYGGILGLPVTFLIGRDGKIAAVYKGQADLPAMQRKIRTLLAAKPLNPSTH